MEAATKIEKREIPDSPADRIVKALRDPYSDLNREIWCQIDRREEYASDGSLSEDSLFAADWWEIGPIVADAIEVMEKEGGRW